MICGCRPVTSVAPKEHPLNGSRSAPELVSVRPVAQTSMPRLLCRVASVPDVPRPRERPAVYCRVTTPHPARCGNLRLPLRLSLKCHQAISTNCPHEFPSLRLHPCASRTTRGTHPEKSPPLRIGTYGPAYPWCAPLRRFGHAIFVQQRISPPRIVRAREPQWRTLASERSPQPKMLLWNSYETSESYAINLRKGKSSALLDVLIEARLTANRNILRRGA